MLSRLRISQRLSLLLAVPIGVTVVIGVPAVVDRIDQSRAAAAVVGGVTDAQSVARLIDDLQEERQLSLAYLASTSVQRSVLIGQYSSTMEHYVRARTAVGGRPPTNYEAGWTCSATSPLTARRCWPGQRRRTMCGPPTATPSPASSMLCA